MDQDGAGAGFGSWSVDRDTLLGMRRSRATKALDDGDLALALAEAEELLDEHPDDVEALRIVARSALALGDARMGSLAAEGILKRRPEDGEAWLDQALAQLHLAELEEGLRSAEQALRLAPGQALAWHLLGLLRHHLGRPGVDEARARAATLDPEGFPLPRPVDAVTWQRALARARRELDPEMVGFYQHVEVRFERRPTLADLRVMVPPASPLVPALPVGQPPEEQAWAHPPHVVRLYTDNLEWPPANAAELGERIRVALEGVALDWGGEDLPDE